MIKAWTKFVQIPGTDTFGYAEYCIEWKNPDLQDLWICSWRFKLEQNHAPKFLATMTGATSLLPTIRLSIFTLESCSFVPINMNSVLSSFSMSLSVSIQFTAFHGSDRISLIKAGFHQRRRRSRSRKRSRQSAYDLVKIKNRIRKRSHMRDGIGVRTIRTFPFLPNPSLTFRLGSSENQIVGVGSRSGRINQSQSTFPRFVVDLALLLLLPTPTIWFSLQITSAT